MDKWETVSVVGSQTSCLLHLRTVWIVVATSLPSSPPDHADRLMDVVATSELDDDSFPDSLPYLVLPNPEDAYMDAYNAQFPIIDECITTFRREVPATDN